MSFPASGVESAYRNKLNDVAELLESKHKDNYLIINVSDRSYDTSLFKNQVRGVNQAANNQNQVLSFFLSIPYQLNTIHPHFMTRLIIYFVSKLTTSLDRYLSACL